MFSARAVLTRVGIRYDKMGDKVTVVTTLTNKTIGNNCSKPATNEIKRVSFRPLTNR